MDDESVKYYPPVVNPQPTRSRRGLKIFGIILLLLLLAGATGYGAYAWLQNRNLSARLASEESKNHTLSEENSRLKSEQDTPTEPEPITTEATLPTGKTLRYPLTEANAQIFWWENNDVVYLSHKKVLDYVMNIAPDTRAKLCGPTAKTDITTAQIAMGPFDTETKKLGQNQAANCLQSLASPTVNKDTASREAAQKVLEEVTKDIDAFLNSATIE